MRRPGSLGPDPDRDDEGLLGRIRAGVRNLTDRLGGDRQQQAMPLSHYRGVTGPVTPYSERRMMLRARRRQHGSYALIFVVVLLVLVVGIFYGLTWALGGLWAGSAPRPTATAQPKPTVAAADVPAVQSSPTVVVLPTAAPGGSPLAPSPSPVASGAPAAPVAGAPPGPTTVATPAGRTYTVKTGDTPNAIARQFNISVDALMRANNITDPTRVRVGQVLVIPESTPTPPR